jgi:hypothetical protein
LSEPQCLPASLQQPAKLNQIRRQCAASESAMQFLPHLSKGAAHQERVSESLLLSDHDALDLLYLDHRGKDLLVN